MKFGEFKLHDAESILLAHTLKPGGNVLKKGSRLNQADLDLLADHGINSVLGAKLSEDDIDEDSAAIRVAKALSGDGLTLSKPMGGRVNLYADHDGVALIDKQQVDAINQGQSLITVATLPEFAATTAQQAVATVKIIPFAVPSALVNLCIRLLENKASPTIALRPYNQYRTGLILTTSVHLKKSVLDSTSNVTRHRLQTLGNDIALELRCDHQLNDVISALEAMITDRCELILICGASVTVDIADTIPTAITSLGGEIEHFGMPVEPGNMLLLARFKDCKIIILPGCSRSPKLNGLDWVLQRHLAGIPVGSDSIWSMGVGGLIKDLPLIQKRSKALKNQQPQLQKPRIDAVVLAAGLSTRMGENNKLLATIGQMSIIQCVVNTLLKSSAARVTIVTGHDADNVRDALSDYDVDFVFNPDYRTGIASSIGCGLKAVDDCAQGALIVLGDMPLLNARHINDLIEVFDSNNERNIVAPFKDGRRGNPILWPRQYFPVLQQLTGDEGAKALLLEYEANIWDVPIDDNAIFVGFDTAHSLKLFE